MAARNARNGIVEEATDVAGGESVSNAVEGDSFDKEVGNFIAGANQNIKLDGSSVCHWLYFLLIQFFLSRGAIMGGSAGWVTGRDGYFFVLVGLA